METQTELKMEFTFDEDTISDLHKDAYGFRPRESFFAAWDSMTDVEKQAEWDSLVSAMEASERRRHEDEMFCIVIFERHVQECITAGAKDRATAIRWMMDSYDNLHGDVEHFEYLSGIPFGYVKRTSV